MLGSSSHVPFKLQGPARTRPGHPQRPHLAAVAGEGVAGCAGARVPDPHLPVIAGGGGPGPLRGQRRRPPRVLGLQVTDATSVHAQLDRVLDAVTDKLAQIWFPRTAQPRDPLPHRRRRHPPRQ